MSLDIVMLLWAAWLNVLDTYFVRQCPACELRTAEFQAIIAMDNQGLTAPLN
jgi:hypothetical protein